MKARPVVVVVDDDAGMGRAIARMVDVAEMEAVVFPSAETMLASAPDTIDCVIADVHLPGIDGIELVGRLDASIPVILVSASEDAEARVQAMPGPARPFLAKPFPAQALLDTLARIVTERNRGDEPPQLRRYS